MRSKSMLVWVGTALLGLVVGGVAACGSSGDANGCVPGDQTACDCPGGVAKGVHVCADDGKSYGTCQCGGVGGGSGSSGSGQGACGDGVPQAGECTVGSEFYCPQDCAGSASSGGPDGGDPCAGHVYYAAMVPNVASVWVSGGLTSFAAGDDMCVKLNMGADHVCDYEEVLAAEKNGELKNIPAATTAWVQRTTSAMVNGKASLPGAGGRCNDWTYSTNHISDGEYITFAAVGVPTYHLDNDTIYNMADPTHTIPGDLECGGATRNILCCYQKCK
jgi:hypothetical protein